MPCRCGRLPNWWAAVQSKFCSSKTTEPTRPASELTPTPNMIRPVIVSSVRDVDAQGSRGRAPSGGPSWNGEFSPKPGRATYGPSGPSRHSLGPLTRPLVVANGRRRRDRHGRSAGCTTVCRAAQGAATAASVLCAAAAVAFSEGPHQRSDSSLAGATRLVSVVYCVRITRSRRLSLGGRFATGLAVRLHLRVRNPHFVHFAAAVGRRPDFVPTQLSRRTLWCRRLACWGS